MYYLQKLSRKIQEKNTCFKTFVKNNFKLFISNNIKLAIKLSLDGAYIPSFNKSFDICLLVLKKILFY